MTSKARIPLPEPDTMSAEQRVVFEAIIGGRRGALVGPLRAALLNPALADRWSKLGEQLRFDTVFEPVQSELAILMTARRWNCELEWAIHREAAVRAGLCETLIDAIRDGKSPEIADRRLAMIYAYVSELLNGGQVSDALYDPVLREWSPIGAVELTALVGYYTMVALTLNAHQIPLPDNYLPDLYPDESSPAGALTALPALRSETERECRR